MSRIPYRLPVALFALLALLALPLSAPAAEPVTDCGQILRHPGALAADLDCSAAADANIHLAGTTLDLAGHTLTANILCDPLAPVDGQRPRPCGISGPGTVHGCVEGIGTVKLDRAAFAYDAGVCGDHAYGIRGSSIVANQVQISGYPRITLFASNFKGANNVASIQLTGSVVSDCGTQSFQAIFASQVGSIRITDSTISGSGSIESYGANARISLLRSVVEHSVWGGALAYEGKLSMVDSTVTDSGSVGASAKGVRLLRSQVSGSCRDEVTDCADIATTASPKLSSGSSCGTSLCSKSASSCGVCTND